MLVLAEKIKLPPELIRAVGEIDKNKISVLADKCQKKGFAILEKENDIVRLGVILELAVRIKERYDKAGIDEKIYYDTMSDIKIWCEKNDNKGLKNYNWLKNHVSFELFRLGRLQFQLYEFWSRRVISEAIPFGNGEKVLFVHIPQGEKLLKEKCIESLKMADGFFSEYLPDYHYSYYFCKSWLLYEGYRDFMKESSNIVQFMSLFEICRSFKEYKDPIERIFGKRRLFKRSYPENTDLQRRAKKYILSGNSLGVGAGIIKRDAYKAP